MKSDDPDKSPAGGVLQRGQSFLYAAEQRAAWDFARRLPAWVTPAHLSCLGAFAAAAAAAALVGSHSWPLLVWVIPPAIAINWFGLTSDLPLARIRNIERAGAGMAHHIAELFSHLLLIVSFGFSPFLTLRSAGVILVCYLLFSSYTYLRAATRHAEQMAYIGIGVTEFRALIALWPFVAMALHVPESRLDPLPAIDVAVFSLALLAVMGLASKWVLDGRKIAAAARHD